MRGCWTPNRARASGAALLDKTMRSAIPVSSAQVASFLRALETLGFWGVPGPDPNRDGLDGAQWVLEGTWKGAYWILDRWSPAPGPYRDACLMLLDFSKMKFEDVY